MRNAFHDRRAAGLELAAVLRARQPSDPVVLGLARGGVPVAYEVARALSAPLDVMVVRKIGAPGNPELAIGAMAEGGVRLFNRSAIQALMIGPEQVAAATAQAADELDTRVRRYRQDRPPLTLRGRTAIVVDDGLATGATARAALSAARSREPARLILAAPVGAPETVASLESQADEVICVWQPADMGAVGFWYRDFKPTSDEEVVTLLAAAAGL